MPESLEKVVLTCLAKKPADRPKDAKALAAMLGACEIGEWTPEDADAWWNGLDAETGGSGARQRARALASTVAASGDSQTIKTIEVDFGDRGAA